MWWILGCIVYFIVGILKLKWFDLNRESDWLIMMTDPRNMRISTKWSVPMLWLCWLTWPLVIFGRKVCLSRWMFNFQWRCL